MPNTAIYTSPGREWNDFYAIQVDRANILFTDGRTGLFCYPGHGDESYRVQDLVPFLPDVNAGAGVSVSECPYAPHGKFLMHYRGRVWHADDENSIVYFSGTRMDYDRNDSASYKWGDEEVLEENNDDSSTIEFTMKENDNTPLPTTYTLEINQTFKAIDGKIVAIQYEVITGLDLVTPDPNNLWSPYIMLEVGDGVNTVSQRLAADDLKVAGVKKIYLDEPLSTLDENDPYFNIFVRTLDPCTVELAASNAVYSDGVLTTPDGGGDSEDDDLTFAIHGKTYTASDTPIKNWELWNIRLDLSRANVAHGGSMIVGNQNAKIRGIWSTNLGVYVFKDNQILLWTWPDSAAPYEVTQGASIEEIASNTGLVAYRTLVTHGNMVIFLGEVENKQFRIFALSGADTQAITPENTMKMLEISDGSTAYGVMQGDYYILFADTGEGVKPFVAVNTVTGAFVELDGPVISCAAVWDAYGKVLVGTDDGAVYQYPGNAAVDVTDNIRWLVEAQMTDAGKPFHENKYRKVWFGADALFGHIPAARSETLTVELDFDDDTQTFSRSFFARDMVTVNLSKRSNGIITRFFGEATGRIRVNNIGVGVRDRRERQ